MVPPFIRISMGAESSAEGDLDFDDCNLVTSDNFPPTLQNNDELWATAIHYEFVAHFIVSRLFLKQMERKNLISVVKGYSQRLRKGLADTLWFHGRHQHLKVYHCLDWRNY